MAEVRGDKADSPPGQPKTDQDQGNQPAKQEDRQKKQEELKEGSLEEKAKFVQAYREKLNRELQTQSEIINERCVLLHRCK